ncbi:hypothetical protein CTAYLR_000974 [Chrysophaeum taylorii]|uniref:BTB domain-containing protein n=1 Tax=Chrysophaeum taylorii TaxID=2483200 RepID=A0AAD7UFW7_9STRA|nr:hypothetical protein CTAYLR_000974 [Chrysophaeum taylorii]
MLSSRVPTVVTGRELVALPGVTWRWVLHDVSTDKKNVGEVEESPNFSWRGYDMRICLYPAGHAPSTAEFCGLFFDIRGGVDHAKFKGELSLLSQGAKKVAQRHKNQHPVPSRHGWSKFCTRDSLAAVVREDRLVIEATVVFYEPAPPSWTPRSTLGSDLRRLLATGDGADAAFRVGCCHFRAHRWLLTVRAPSLAALVDDADIVPLDGVDPNVFQKVLDFVYSDAVDRAALAATPRAFLRVANLCGVVRLKQLAELDLANTLSVSNAADLLLLADATDCAHLFELACDIVVANLKDVIHTSGWTHLREAPKLLAHILERAAGDDARPAKRRRVNDLRAECERRGLDTDGARDLLVLRLQDHHHSAPVCTPSPSGELVYSAV